MSEGVMPVEENQTETKNTLSFGSSLKRNLKDVADQIFKPQPVDLQNPPSRLSLFLILLGVVIYVADVGSDIYLAVQYYNSGQLLYFKLTLTFVLLPFAVLFAIFITTSIENGYWKQPGFVIIPIIFLFIPIGVETAPLFYGLKSRGASSSESCQKYHLKMLQESSTSSLRKLNETFLESAPQATLQTFILIVQQRENGQGPSAWKLISLGLSLLGLAWSLASHNRRTLAAHKQRLTVAYIGSVVESLGYFLLITSTCFALAAFASVYSLHHVVISTVIYLVLMWIFVAAAQEIQKWGTSLNKILKNVAVSGVVAWMCCYVLFHLGQSFFISFKKKDIVFYYIFMFIVNSFALLIWMDSIYESGSSEGEVNLAVGKVVANFVLFFLGVACLLLYNVKYHPSNIQDNFPVAENLPVQLGWVGFSRSFH